MFSFNIFPCRYLALPHFASDSQMSDLEDDSFDSWTSEELKELWFPPSPTTSEEPGEEDPDDAAMELSESASISSASEGAEPAEADLNQRLPDVHGFLRFFRLIRNDIAGSEFLQPGGARLGAACAERWLALDSVTKECYSKRSKGSVESKGLKGKRSQTKKVKPKETNPGNAKESPESPESARAPKVPKVTAKPTAKPPKTKSSPATKYQFLMTLSVPCIRGKLRYAGAAPSDIRRCIEKSELVLMLMEKCNLGDPTTCKRPVKGLVKPGTK